VVCDKRERIRQQDFLKQISQHLALELWTKLGFKNVPSIVSDVAVYITPPPLLKLSIMGVLSWGNFLRIQGYFNGLKY